MNRRQYITTIGATSSLLALAGCSSDNGSDSDDSSDDSDDGDDSGDNSTDNGDSSTDNSDTSGGTTTGEGSLYDVSMRDDMLLSVDSFPAGWDRDREEEEDDAVRLFSDETEEEVVAIRTEIYDDVAEAESEFETSMAGYSETNEYTIADESFWTISDNAAITVFRHSNAIGASVAISNGEADQFRSQDYAELLYEEWQTV